VEEKKLRKGGLRAQHSSPVPVLKWSHEKEVTMIPTDHGEETRIQQTKHAQEKEKPISVPDYNKNMGALDLKNQPLQPYLLERKKTTKWFTML
jgi:hypothetical protein